MRTTVEITDEQRAELLRIAAKRGEKGFSGLIREALERWLEEHASADERVRLALGARGSLRESDADALEASVRALRGTWR